jgi:hypothetical protein
VLAQEGHLGVAELLVVGHAADARWGAGQNRCGMPEGGGRPS